MKKAMDGKEKIDTKHSLSKAKHAQWKRPMTEKTREQKTLGKYQSKIAQVEWEGQTRHRKL